MWRVRNMDEADAFIRYIKFCVEQGNERIYQIEHPTLTIRQNRAIHAFLGHLARLYNDHDITVAAVSEVLQSRVSVEWTGDMAKEAIWRPLQKAITGKRSSTKIDTAQVSTIVGAVQRMSADHLGVSVPFGIHQLVDEGSGGLEYAGR